MLSPFLQVDASNYVVSNEWCFVIFDANPVSKGHVLIVPRRLIESWFEATPAEQLAAVELLGQVKRLLDERFRPDGYNVGFNDGAAAGQTVRHAHLHVMPRYAGDMADPRGGVRHAIAGRGNYLTSS